MRLGEERRVVLGQEAALVEAQFRVLRLRGDGGLSYTATSFWMSSVRRLITSRLARQAFTSMPRRSAAAPLRVFTGRAPDSD